MYRFNLTISRGVDATGINCVMYGVPRSLCAAGVLQDYSPSGIFSRFMDPMAAIYGGLANATWFVEVIGQPTPTLLTFFPVAAPMIAHNDIWFNVPSVVQIQCSGKAFCGAIKIENAPTNPQVLV